MASHASFVEPVLGSDREAMGGASTASTRTHLLKSFLVQHSTDRAKILNGLQEKDSESDHVKAIPHGSCQAEYW